jgi:hypothetical protein
VTSVTELLAGVAAQAAREFAGGRNGRVRGSAVVHAVHFERWLGEIRVPAPACRIGISGFDLAALTPTDDPVTCARCQHIPGRGGPAHPGTEQLPLWPAPVPAADVAGAAVVPDDGGDSADLAGDDDGPDAGEPTDQLW